MTEVEGLAKLTDELYKYMPTEVMYAMIAFLMSGIDIDDLKTAKNSNLSAGTVVF